MAVTIWPTAELTRQRGEMSRAVTICVADIFVWLRARPDQPRGDPGNTP